MAVVVPTPPAVGTFVLIVVDGSLQWIRQESLRGRPGERGPAGPAGPKGTDGRDAPALNIQLVAESA